MRATADTSSPAERKKAKGLLKRLTSRLRRDRRAEDPHSPDHPHSLDRLSCKETGKDATVCDQPVADGDGAVEEGKSKPCTDKNAAPRKPSRREQLLNRSRKYALARLGSRHGTEARQDRQAQVKEEEEEGIIAESVMKERKQKQTKGKRERKEKKEDAINTGQSGRPSDAPAEAHQRASAEAQALSREQVVRPVARTDPQGAVNLCVVQRPAYPPRAFNEEVLHLLLLWSSSCGINSLIPQASNPDGLGAIEKAITDVTTKIAPELRPNTPQMTLVTYPFS